MEFFIYEAGAQCYICEISNNFMIVDKQWLIRIFNNLDLLQYTPNNLNTSEYSTLFFNSHNKARQFITLIEAHLVMKKLGNSNEKI